MPTPDRPAGGPGRLTARGRRDRVQSPEDPGGIGLYRPRRRTVYLLLGGLIAVALVRALVHSHGEDSATLGLTTSCTAPAFTVGVTTVAREAVLRVAVTGPADGSYRLLLDVGSLTGAVSLPADGHTPPGTQLLVSENGLPSCAARQVAALTPMIAAGTHTLVLFESAPGSAPRAVQRQVLVVR